MKNSVLLGMLTLSTFTVRGQWIETGNTGTDWTTDFLGTTDDVRLTLRTYDKFRLVVNEEDNYTIESFSSIPTSGFVGISPSSYFWDNGPGPFSRLHLAEPGANGFQSIGYRPWMRNGVTLTGNHDHAYIGQRSYGHDSTDMVISS